MIVAADEQQKLGEKTLKHLAEVDAKFHVEEEKAAEIKKQVQHSSRCIEGGSSGQHSQESQRWASSRRFKV